jgi:hypothetical protein
MAAILPNLEVPEDISILEREYSKCASSMHGATLGENSPSCPSPDTVIAEAHAGLLNMVFVREAVEQSLIDVTFIAQAGNLAGKDTKGVYLVLDKPIGRGPAWNPTTNPDVQQYSLLSWTSKMACPSFSLPAGDITIGGSCPGAAAGQSVVPEGRLVAAQRLVAKIIKKEVNLAQCICEHCYSMGGQYSTGQVQYAQILRYLWARQAINVVAPAPDGSPSTAFIETMVYAIDNANFYLQGSKGEDAELVPEQSGKKFFRIHDSGDFFEEEYLSQWKQIARRLPHIHFWAPSRIWATSWGIDAVNKINSPIDNLVIRPSSYEINEHPPRDLGPGWSAGSTVIAADQFLGMTSELEKYVYEHAQRVAVRPNGPDPRADWNCQAYSTEDAKHTCRKAVAPPGKGGVAGKGCRACWLSTDLVVNYTLH